MRNYTRRRNKGRTSKSQANNVARKLHNNNNIHSKENDDNVKKKKKIIAILMMSVRLIEKSAQIIMRATVSPNSYHGTDSYHKYGPT